MKKHILAIILLLLTIPAFGIFRSRGQFQQNTTTGIITETDPCFATAKVDRMDANDANFYGRVYGSSFSKGIISPAQRCASLLQRASYVVMCDDLNLWTTSGGLTVSKDDVNYMAWKTSPRALLMSWNGSDGNNYGLVSRTIPTTDVNNSHIYINFHINSGDGNTSYNHLGNLCFHLIDADGRDATAYLWTGDDDTHKGTGPGWYEEVLIPESPNWTSIDSGFDWGRVTQIQFDFTLREGHRNGNYSSITASEVAFIPQCSPIVVWHLATATNYGTYQAATYAKVAGMLTNISACVKAIRDNTGYSMPLSQLQTLRDAGHFVFTYPYNYDSDVYPLGWHDINLPEKVNLLIYCQNWMRQSGFEAGARTIELPATVMWGTNGHYTDDTYVLNNYLDQVSGTNTGTGVYAPSGICDPRLVPIGCSTLLTDFATQYALIKKRGGVLLALTHVADANQLASFKTAVDLVAPDAKISRVKVLLLPELLKYQEPISNSISGWVTLANMQISAVDGNAFADFNTLYALTPYTDCNLTITDSNGNNLGGWIGPASAGVTYGPKLLANPTFNDDVCNWTPYSDAAIASVSGGVDGNCLQLTVGSTGEYTYSDNVSTTPLSLIYYGAWVKNGTDANKPFYIYTNSSPQIAGSSAASWVFYSNRYVEPSSQESLTLRGHIRNNRTMLFDTATMKQILTPDANGVMITSTKNGPIYSWALKDPNFNYNDSLGYKYRIAPSP